MALTDVFGGIPAARSYHRRFANNGLMENHETPTPADRKPERKLRKELSFIARKGPASLAASTLPGLVNYAIIVYLVHTSGAAAAGEYRIVFSLFAMTGLLTLLESSKLFVRAAAAQDGAAAARIFAGRLWFVAVAFAIALPAWFMLKAVAPDLIRWSPEPAQWFIAAAALLHFLTDSWLPVLQARSAFGRIFLLALCKYLGAVAVFLGMRFTGFTVVESAMGQLAVMTAFNLGCFVRIVVSSFGGGSAPAGPFAALGTPDFRETLVISAASAPANSIDHVDKLVIGAIFGLEVLGLYTLSVSTGRLIYNGIKPSLYIYYKRFTEGLPTQQTLLLVGVAFTAVGAAMALGYWLAVTNLPQLERFRGGEAIAAVVFLAYGVNMADNIYSQAYAINAEARSSHLLYANSASCLVVFACFAVFAALPASLALIGFATAFGLRHAITLAILIVLRRRQVAEGSRQ